MSKPISNLSPPNMSYPTLTPDSIAHFLPIEILRKIADDLNSPQDIVHFGLANRDLYIRFLSDIPLWKSFLRKHFPDACAKLQSDSESLMLCKELTKIVNNMKAGRYSTQILKGHLNKVISFATYGDQLISGSADHTIKIWDLNAGKEIGTFVGHQALISCLIVNGDHLISGSWDRTIKIWDLNTGKEIGTLVGHREEVTCLAVNSNKLISGSWDHTIKVWDLDTRKELYKLNHSFLVRCIAVWGNHLISGSFEGTIKVWELNTQKKIMTLQGPVELMCLATHGNHMIVGDSTGKIRTWDLNTGKKLMTLAELSKQASFQSITVWYHLLISGLDNGTIKIFDLNTGKEIKSFNHSASNIKCIAFHEGKIIFGLVDGRISILDFNSV